MPRSIPTRFTLLLSLLVRVAAPDAQTPGTTSTGSVKGHVKLLPNKIRGTALPSTAYPARAVGRHDGPAIPEIGNVVVYLKDVVFRGALPPRRSGVRQENETFVPHTLAITRGSTVDFPNADPFFHNVFSLSSAANFNLGRYPRGDSRQQTFAMPGIVKVFCQIHSHMSATILVFDHPYFTVPSPDGTYELPNLPPGEYTLVGWHERVGERTARVRVQAGQATPVDLSLPVEDTP
jgi:hypothetical protein